MRLKAFIEDRLIGFYLHIVSIAMLAVFLLLTGVSGGIVAIILVVWGAGFSLSLTFSFLKSKKRIEELESIMAELPEKYLFAECTGSPQSNYERHMFEFMRKSGKSMIEAVSDAQAAQQEYREYIESWVHEIKAPITAAELICRNADSETRRKLMRELENIENHVERALFYARAESAEKDFMISRAELSDLVVQAIDKHRALFIQNGVRIETGDLDHIVYTDSKWAVFMLSQFLQNAVRYRKESPFISVSAETLGRLTRLVIQDNGIGIPEHELPRIFDRGFTGSNGRMRGGSTGMGLYICQRLAAFLFVEMKVESQIGEGTSVTMVFPATENNLSKM